MSQSDLVQVLETQVREVCDARSRYRVLWVVGGPRSGKTALCRALCAKTGWRYLDFTRAPEGLGTLRGREERYRPEDFLAWLQGIYTGQEVVVIDEIEPLLGWWDHPTRETFFSLVGRLARLSAGVVIATRLKTASELDVILALKGHTFEMNQGG